MDTSSQRAEFALNGASEISMSTYNVADGYTETTIVKNQYDRNHCTSDNLSSAMVCSSFSPGLLNTAYSDYIQDPQFSTSQFYEVSSGTNQRGYRELHELNSTGGNSSYIDTQPMCDDSLGKESSYRSISLSDHDVATNVSCNLPLRTNLLTVTSNNCFNHAYNSVSPKYQCSTLSSSYVQNMQQGHTQCNDEVMECESSYQSMKAEVGVQCELGPESILALFDDDSVDAVRKMDDLPLPGKSKLFFYRVISRIPLNDTAVRLGD